MSLLPGMGDNSPFAYVGALHRMATKTKDCPVGKLGGSVAVWNGYIPKQLC